MGLKKVTSAGPVDLKQHVRTNIDPPSVLIYRPAQLQFKYLSLRMLGVTAFTSDRQIAAVQDAAEPISDDDDYDWTVADAMRILRAAGSSPAPTHFTIAPTKGEGVLVMRAVSPGTPAAEALNYNKGSARVSILGAMEPEGIKVPKGMAMDVPVRLVDDEGAIGLALYLRRGKLRKVTEVKKEVPPADEAAFAEQADEEQADEEK